MSRPTLASLEFVVEDLDKSLELFVELIGLEIMSRNQHPVLAAEVAMISAGPIVITLLEPNDDPERTPMSAPEPRLAQMALVVPSEEELIGLRDRLIDAGAAVMSDSPQMFHLSETMIEGVLGRAPAPVFLVSPKLGEGT
jgi:catechol-2,3-dioxygenase